MKKTLAISFLLLLPIILTAQSPGNGEYALTKYKIDMIVNENNSFLITENITAYYHVDKRGIERLLPLQNKIIRLDGTQSYNRAKISNIEVKGDIFKVYNESGNRVISVGDETFITGSKDYEITYLYDIGKDKGKGFDDFYFNLIGDKWDTTIEGIEFTITMPKSFDESKLGFSSGLKNATENSNISYEVNGKVISGRYEGILKAEEAITVRLELPDGYFVVEDDDSLDLMMSLSLIIPIVFVFLAIGLWLRIGRGEKPVEVIEFYPPEGFNSAEIGFLYTGSADATDVVSLLIYLANKGYIKIEEIEEKKSFVESSGYKITKLKEYDGDNSNERLFLSGLFKPKLSGIFSALLAKTQIEEKDEVKLSELKNNFYTTLNAIVDSLNAKANKQKIFEKNSLNKNFYFWIMAIAILALVTFVPMNEYDDIGVVISSILFTEIGYLLFIALTVVRINVNISINGKPTKSAMPAILMGLAFGVCFGAPLFIFSILPALSLDKVYMFNYLNGIACIIIIFFCMKHIKKRTEYGNKLLGRIIGFKTFLDTAEKHKLEALVTKNPEYFYHILPFTYVLGVSNKWIKKFENIAFEAPKWYSGRSAFNTATFGHSINKTMIIASKAMSQRPSKGGSGSGGGVSGGGSGGGGGRSR